MKGGTRNAEGETGSTRNVDLRARTRRFALDVIRFVKGLERGQTAQVLGRQLLRSATSVGANYHAPQRARSTAEFVAKLGIVEEEADETIYWLELLHESSHANTDDERVLCREAGELLAITIASIRTARRSIRR